MPAQSQIENTSALSGRSFPTPASHECVTLAEAFRDVRRFTMNWAQMLTPEDLMVQSCAEASPVKWHLAHTTWFFETFLLREFLPGYRALNDDYLWLFNSYYNSVSDQPDKALRSSFSRPSLDEVTAYRAHVEYAIADLLAKAQRGEISQARAEEVTRRVVLGIHHEQQHQELIAYDIKNAFWSNPLRPALRPLPGVPPALMKDGRAYKTYSPGLTEIGAADSGAPDSFAWDNEQPRHKYFLQDFQLATHLVNCRDYAEFIADGGYRKPALWLSAGWDAVTQNGWKAPLYWAEHDGAWSVYTLHGMLPLHDLMDTPVCHVSHYEADAYARWAGARLPSEFEWEAAAAHDHMKNAGLLTSANLQYGFLHPSGHPSLFGDVWQWTQSAYTAYPGYRAPDGALGEYNGKFMSGQMVLRGGSVVTPYGHLRAAYRNFFHAPVRWQFAGIRLAKDGI